MLALSPLFICTPTPRRRKLLAFFTEALGFDLVQVRHVSPPEPMYAFKFGNGTVLRVEFLKRRLTLPPAAALSGIRSVISRW